MQPQVRPHGCVADLLAILTNIPTDWRRCPCPTCSPDCNVAASPPTRDWKSAAANDDRKEN